MVHSNKRQQIRAFVYELNQRFTGSQSLPEPPDWDAALLLLKESVEAVAPDKR